MAGTFAIYRVWEGETAPGNIRHNGMLVGQMERLIRCDRDKLLAVCSEIEDADGFSDWPRRIRKATGTEE